MMAQIYVKVYTEDFKDIYDRFIVDFEGLHEYLPPQKGKHLILQANGVRMHCLSDVLSKCEQCRTLFLEYFLQKANVNKIKIMLGPQSQCPDTIDYNWNEKINVLVQERCELDHTLSWLSTLGGAFSALGDYFDNCAETAGKISMHQFELALRLNDPAVVSRCRLYFALSLIQRKHFKMARAIVAQEFELATLASVRDDRLIRMCKGIWSKLQYEWKIHKKRNSIKT